MNLSKWDFTFVREKRHCMDADVRVRAARVSLRQYAMAIPAGKK